MTASEHSPHFWNSAASSSADDAEAQLQQELRAMFAVDTQQQLQDYFSLVQQLNAGSWTADIQHIYRAIHTIKGGSVTVEADAMLRAATMLEDLLSDLRYLDQAPALGDGQLSQMLLEAGELLSSSIDITGTGEWAIAQVQPTVQRIQMLHEQIKQRYLPDWNELKQVHQEFAEQGFDLVVLELEMALEQALVQDTVPPNVLATAQQTLAQLHQIGQDLQLAEGWSTLLQDCTTLQTHPQSVVWKTVWPEYLRALKNCAKASGDLDPDHQTHLQQIYTAAVHQAAISPTPSEEPEMPHATPLAQAEALTLAPLEIDHLSVGEWIPDLSLDELPSLELAIAELNSSATAESLLNQADTVDELLDILPTALSPFGESIATEGWLSDAELTPLLNDADGLLATNWIAAADVESLPPESIGLFPTPQPLVPPPSMPVSETPPESKRSLQVPVPLERLDQSAQQVVDTLLTARTVMNVSQKLQDQLAQLTSLTQESAQFVTRLRQLQDDYALLRNLSDEQDANSLSLERYRQGYTTINRLLENILRMSELGQEIETVAQQTTGRLDKLDRSILRLKDGIETSRLVPFGNLSLRARAIVRDLGNRYGKPAELLVEGEQVELDAGIVQQLEPALLHLLRNAYDHGLESIEERLNQGKPAQGTIQLSLRRRGNLYRLVLKDDGKGIDAAAIQQLAQAKGFTLTQTRTATELLAVLCQPGFSSRSAVTEVSGRGVGMDVVAGQIADIGGKLSLETHPGQGTTFTIEVPAPQLLVPCVLLQVGDRTLALPSEEVLETTLLSTVQATPTTDDTQYDWAIKTQRAEALGFDLARYWQGATTKDELGQSGTVARTLAETAIGIRTKAAAETGELWLLADNLLGQEELLINPLPSPLISPLGLLGVSLQPDGRLISVLDPMVLTEAIQSTPNLTGAAITPTAAPVPVATASRILVVDDAALIRRRFEGSLNTYGFITYTCADGLEALKWLQTNEQPDLIITDVEMPNMDGFTLIDRCRQIGINRPILVVSSRLSEDWGREARRLGASDYLNKGFSTAELISKVKHLLEVSYVPVSP